MDDAGAVHAFQTVEQLGSYERVCAREAAGEAEHSKT
jgi:hypothetical protein